MRKVLVLIGTLLLPFVLIACTDQRVIERLGFIHTIAYDLAAKGKNGTNRLLITMSLPQVEESASESREVLTATAFSSKDAREKLSRQTNRLLVTGQLRNVLIGMPLAKKGLSPTLNTLVRDPAIGPHVKITIVDGNANDMLRKNFPQHPRTSQYVDRMLEKEAELHGYSEVNTYTFVRDLLDDGIDPIAPAVKTGKNSVILEGIALFNEDRVIKILSSKQARMLMMLRENYKLGEISMNVSSKEGSKKEQVMFTPIINKRKVTVEHTDPHHMKVHMYLDLKGSISEYNGELDLRKNTDQYKLETLLAQYVRNAEKKIIKDLQKHRADPLGIGEHVRNSMSYQKWHTLKWKQVYPTLDIDCHVKVRIKDVGKFSLQPR